jgi:hypothetical protein
LEVTIIELGWDGENWNDPYLVLWIPLGRKVGKTSVVIGLLSLLTSLIVHKI